MKRYILFFLLICSWNVLASRTIYIDAADVETLYMVMNDMKANNKSNYFLFIESGKESIEFLFTRQGLMGEVTEKQKNIPAGEQIRYIVDKNKMTILKKEVIYGR